MAVAEAHLAAQALAVGLLPVLPPREARLPLLRRLLVGARRLPLPHLPILQRLHLLLPHIHLKLSLRHVCPIHCGIKCAEQRQVWAGGRRQLEMQNGGAAQPQRLQTGPGFSSCSRYIRRLRRRVGVAAERG